MKTTHPQIKHIKIRGDELRAIAKSMLNKEVDALSEDDSELSELEHLALGLELASYCYTIRNKGSKLLVNC